MGGAWRIASHFLVTRDQALLSRLETQINEYQRDKQLKEHRRMVVDVQVGFEGASVSKIPR